MNRRDVELLDKQLWGVSPHPPRTGGARVLVICAVFLVGIAAGSFLFSPQHSRGRSALNGEPTSVFLLDAAPSPSGK